jgi:gliding motility-associated-like protein
VRLKILFFSIVLSNILFAQIPSYVPSNGLVGWWPFDGNANDYSGNGNHGTVNGATLTTDRNSTPNSAYYFSSSGCATRIDANVNTSSIQSGLSISIWVLRTGNGCIGPRLLEFWPGNNGPGQAQWGWDNSTTSIGMGSTTSTGFACNSSVPIAANNVWIHLVYTNNGSVGKFYSNGALISTVASNGNPILAGSVSFGRMNHPAWDAFNGKLDDIGVWSRALTDCEVQQLYLSQVNNSANVNGGTDQTVCSGSPISLTATGASTYTWTGGVQNGVPFIPTASGQYIVTGTNPNGCSGTDTVQVTLVPNPVINASNDTICLGQSTTLTASGLTSNQSNCIGNPGSPNPWPFPSAANGGYIPLGTFGAQNVFSISMWINPAQVQNGISIILDASHGGSSNWVIQTLNSGSTWTWGNGVFTLTPNAWQHLLLTYNNGARKIFINGVEVQSWNQLISYSGSPALYLGNWPEGGRRFNGLIDELYITNDIQYTANFTPLETIQNTSSQTFGLWYFDEGTGLSTNDLANSNFPLNNWYWSTRPLSATYSLSWSPGGATTPSITVSPNVTTNYTCNVTYSNGLSCSSNQNIIVSPLQISAGPDLTVLSGSSVTLTATGGSSYTWSGGIQNAVSFNPTATQTYIVTGTNSQGCIGTDTVVVNVVQPPSISITASSTSICVGDSITLTAQLNQPSTLSLNFPYSKLNGPEIWVSPSGNNSTGNGTFSNPYQTIQHAIDISSNGQIITIKTGTYSGSGNVNITTLGKQITVQSENGPLSTIIDCNQSGRAFIANSGESMNTVIKGIKIINGKTNSAPLGYGSAIFVEDNSGLKIVDCIFESNIEGCIQFGDNEVSGPQSAIENCAFIQNQVSCISAAKKSFYTESCFFYNNTSNGELFGNGHVANPAQYYQNCVFKCNTGHIIGALGHGKLMNNSLFIGNTSTQGTIYMGTNWSGTNTIDHCTFYNNSCNYYNSGWFDHTGQVLSSIFYPGDARNHVSGNQGQIPFSNSLGGNISGNGNIQGNPMFANPSSNNFQLQSGSPCIGTGASGTNMGANVTLIQPWLFNFLDYYSQSYPSILWSNGATTTSVSMAPTTSGYVYVTYSGCGNTITDSIYIQISPLTTVNAGPDQTICPGSSITLNGSGAISYAWSGGVQNGVAFTPLTPGSFVLTGTNSTGCIGTDTVEILFYSLPSINAGQDQTVCAGDSVILTATGANTYTWTGSVQNDVPFIPTSSGQYIVTGTNANGCLGTDTIQVTLVPNPIITALDSVICTGDSTQLTASAPNLGAGQSCTGSSPVNYAFWTPIAATDSYTNILKEGSSYYLRSQNNVYQSSSLIGPWNSMNFNTQIGNTLAGRMLGMDWNNRLFVSTGHNSLYAYNNGTWQDMGLGGFGCGGNFIQKLANGRIIVEKNGYLRDLYISDNNGATYTNVTNVDNDYFDMIVAPNGIIYACGGSNTPSMTGLIKSTNNGTSFTHINSQLGIAYCSGFAKDCSGSIYAVADNKIFKSIDGNTWQQQCLIPAAFTSNPGYSFLVVASNGDYYLWGYANASINGLFKSSNLGQTWSQITDLPVPVANVTNLKEIDGNIVVVTTQGIYAKTILQSPTFVWSTGATTPTISVNPSTTTTYMVTVDYGNGLTCSSSFTITVNPIDTVNAGIDQSVCAGSSVTLSATGATSYSWSGGVQNGVAFVPSVSGQYIVTSTNSVCVGIDTVDIIVNSNPTVSGTAINPLCSNLSGEIAITISSGQAPYTVLWSNGANSNTIQNLSSGIYTVSVTDNNNCIAAASYTISIPSPISLSAVVANSNCTNSATGAIDISVSGGTAPYFYTWSNGATIQDLTNLLGGTYAITVTDNNGCTESDSFQITQTTGLSITSNVVNPTCGTTNNGLIDISVFGGTPAYAYLWSNGSSTQDLSSLGTGTYSVSVTDANGCVATVVYTLTAPIPLSISFTNNNIGCFGDSTGYINSNVTGGQSPYSYFWNTGANTPNITNVIAGTYTLTVNDAGGCTSTSSVQIYQPQLPLVISAAITPSQCFGVNNGSIDIFATGGTVLYNYNWSNGATTQDLQNISSGNYSLILTDGNGCIYDTAFVVSQPALPLTSQTSQVNVSCQNGNNGFVNLTVSGGQQPYSYNWSNGQTTQDLFSLSAGTYTLILTDGNGCIAYDTVTIVQPSIAFSLGGVITNVACFGASTGFIDLNVSGGVAPYTYIWNNGGSNQDLSNLQAGNYNIIVFDANNCQESQSFSITQPTFDLQANTVVEDLICTSNETGSIDVTVTGGTSPYSYLWTNGQTVQDLINVGTGNYSLTISDNNGCQITLSENISAPAQPLTTSATTANVSCFGFSDGQITLATLGGVSPYEYQWSNGQTASLIDSLTAGLYSVLVTDANGCENSLSVQITQPNQILNNFSSSTQLGCIPAHIDFTYPVNDPTLSFSWDFGNGQSSNVQNPSYTYLSAGCFDVSLTITAANGCVVNSILDSMICIVQGPEAAFYSTNSTIDYYTGELALFDNSEGSILSYLWTLGDSSPNQTTQNIIHYYTPYTEENYNVSLTVTDTNGCSDVASIVFSLIEEFEIYVPNTFTLNGDLLNDGFLPIFSNVDVLKDYELVIYNRWGNLVWQTTNPTEPWFGRYKDAYDVQVGTYTWKIKYTDNKSVTRSLVGHVNVLK